MLRIIRDDVKFVLLILALAAVATVVFAFSVATSAPFANFPIALQHVLKHEGGFSDHPSDPGGRTLEGVTQKVYDRFRDAQGLPRRQLTPAMRPTDEWKAERNQIYRELYWDPIGGDGLPRGLDYALFDYAVHSGRGRAGKVARCLTATTMPLDACIAASRNFEVTDGVLNHLGRLDVATAIRAVWDERGRFHARLIAANPQLGAFKNGWANRRASGRAIALTMAGVRRGNVTALRALPGPFKAYAAEDLADEEVLP